MPNFYLVDMVTDNDGLIQAAGNMSLNILKATISSVRADLSGDLFPTRWSVDAANWEATLDYANPAADPQAVTYRFHYWYGGGPSHRVTYQDKGLGVGHIAPGDFTLQGSATLSTAMPGPTVPFAGHYFTGILVPRFGGRYRSGRSRARGLAFPITGFGGEIGPILSPDPRWARLSLNLVGFWKARTPFVEGANLLSERGKCFLESSLNMSIHLYARFSRLFSSGFAAGYLYGAVSPPTTRSQA